MDESAALNTVVSEYNADVWEKKLKKEKCIQNVAEGEHADRVTIKVQRYSTNHERKRKKNKCVNIAIKNLYSIFILENTKASSKCYRLSVPLVFF